MNYTTSKRHEMTCLFRGCSGKFYLSVNVLSTKVLTENTILSSPTGDGTDILRGHASHAKVQPDLRGKGSTYVYIIILADQVFIDPTFFGIFVCSPLQSLVVNVCTKSSTFISQ